MSVILYCEGKPQSPDVRVITQLVPRTCSIKPIGSKGGFAEKIIGDRTINPRLVGLADRDFDCRDFTPQNSPQDWFYGGERIGWSWERKEIENYLLDPEVVQRALGKKAPPMGKYKAALEEAAAKIAAYTAARTALSCFRFPNSWGDKVSKTHSFPGFSKIGRDKCRDKIAEIVSDKKGERIVEVDNVLEKFDRLRKQYRSGGSRFEYYLTFSAGKDLLHAMRDRLKNFGFNSTEGFLERVIKGMEASPDEVYEWIPEWRKIRDLLAEF